MIGSNENELAALQQEWTRRASVVAEISRCLLFKEKTTIADNEVEKNQMDALQEYAKLSSLSFNDGSKALSPAILD